VKTQQPSQSTIDPSPHERNGKSPKLDDGPFFSIHSLLLYIKGIEVLQHLDQIKSSPLKPHLFGVRVAKDLETGEVVSFRGFARVDFVDPANAALLPLEGAAERLATALAESPWLDFPGVTVNRIDLTADHAVPDPAALRDRIENVKLPYSYVHRGTDENGDRHNALYHFSGREDRRGENGRHRVVAAHYDRLRHLRERHPDAPPEAIEHCRNLLRQEVRFKHKSIWDRIGGGSASLKAVLSSLGAFVNFALRRLKPICSAGLLPPPHRDAIGEAKLAELWPSAGP